jgi:Legionella pneumophila major outer membrane protein precursor
MNGGAKRIWSAVLLLGGSMAAPLMAAPPQDGLPPVPVPIVPVSAVDSGSPVFPPSLPPHAPPAPLSAQPPRVIPAPPTAVNLPANLQGPTEVHTTDIHEVHAVEPMEEHHEAHNDDAHNAWLFDAQYLYMRVRRQPEDYVLVNPTGDPTRAIGTQQDIGWDWRSGMRLGFGYQFGEQWDAMFHYTYLHSANIERTASDGTSVLQPTLTHPGFVEQALTAEADNSFNYNVFDVEFGKQVYHCNGTWFRIFGGPRFAKVDQAVNANYNGLDANQDQVRAHQSFDGGGLRVGGEGVLEFAKGLGLYCNASGSMLVGNVRTSLTETNNAGASTIVDVSDRFDMVIPVAEITMGIQYQRRNLRLMAGYQFVNWFGLQQQLDYANDSQVAKPIRRSGDLSLDGLVLQAMFIY